MTQLETYLSQGQQALRYGVAVRTIERWEVTTELQYPAAIDINGRRYRALSTLEAWERSRAVIAAGNVAALREKQARADAAAA